MSDIICNQVITNILGKSASVTTNGYTYVSVLGKRNGDMKMDATTIYVLGRLARFSEVDAITINVLGPVVPKSVMVFEASVSVLVPSNAFNIEVK